MRGLSIVIAMTLALSGATANAGELNEEAMQIGAVSGAAEACGLEWKPHFHAYMASKRHSGVSEKDMTFVAVYHGAGQQQAFDELQGKCDASTKADTKKAIRANIEKFTD